MAKGLISKVSHLNMLNSAIGACTAFVWRLRKGACPPRLRASTGKLGWVKFKELKVLKDIESF